MRWRAARFAVAVLLLIPAAGAAGAEGPARGAVADAALDHRRCLDSGLAHDVFVELRRGGLDRLRASERVAANWTAEHFREFLHNGGGYGRLVLLADAPENDGRLASSRQQPKFSQVVEFNPDGTVESVRRGERTVALAASDYARNVSAGTVLRLPPVATADDLAAVRAVLDALFRP